MNDPVPITDSDLHMAPAQQAASEAAPAPDVASAAKSALPVLTEWIGSHLKTTIGGVSLAAIVASLMLGFGIDLKERDWLYGLLYRPNFSGEVSLQPGLLTLVVANSGHRDMEVTFQQVEVTSRETGPSTIPAEQMSWSGRNAPEGQQGRVQVNRYDGTPTLTGTAQSTRGEDVDFFTNGEQCDFIVTLQVAGEPRTSRPCRCGTTCAF